MINIFKHNHIGNLIQLTVTQKQGTIKKRKVKTWTSQQDTLLTKLYQEYPKKWSIISNMMPDRNQNQCLHRFRRLSQLGNQKKIWSEQQDETIKKYIKKVGKNWKLLSEMLGSKTGKQIRQRYINKLDPKIKKQQWSECQDMKLIELYSEIGSRWSQIAKKLPGRPQNKIKNRFYSFIKRNYQIKQTVVKQKQNQDIIMQSQSSQQNLAKYSQNQTTQTIILTKQTQLIQYNLNRTSYSELPESNYFTPSKLMLEGSQQLIRQMKFTQQKNQITSYANIPQADYLIYLDGVKLKYEQI